MSNSDQKKQLLGREKAIAIGTSRGLLLVQRLALLLVPVLVQFSDENLLINSAELTQSDPAQT